LDEKTAKTTAKIGKIFRKPMRGAAGCGILGLLLKSTSGAAGNVRHADGREHIRYWKF
jgi:hypothetical protein